MRVLRTHRNGRPVTRRGRGPLRRAATMLEFAFILPIFMFMIMFCLDMGHMVLMSGAMQDATFAAARTGAQVGGASVDGQTGTVTCPTSGNCPRGSTYRALLETAGQIPGTSTMLTDPQMTIEHGGVCASSGDDDHVEITTTYDVSLITPGLINMLDMFSSGQKSSTDGSAWEMHATAVARCEIIRSN